MEFYSSTFTFRMLRLLTAKLDHRHCCEIMNAGTALRFPGIVLVRCRAGRSFQSAQSEITDQIDTVDKKDEILFDEEACDVEEVPDLATVETDKLLVKETQLHIWLPVHIRKDFWWRLIPPFMVRRPSVCRYCSMARGIYVMPEDVLRNEQINLLGEDFLGEPRRVERFLSTQNEGK